MRLRLAASLAGAFLFLGVPVFASPVSLCGSNTGNMGNSFSVSGIGASGWQGTSTSSTNSPTALFCKNGGANEDGLGIASDIDHEIGTTNFIQLSGLSGSVTLNIQSVQSGEGFGIFGSNSHGVLGTSSLGSMSGGNTDNITVNLTGFTYLDVTATGGNVLIDTASSSTPEPGTYLLMGTGLLMFGFFLRRRFAPASC